jgi:GST-like protein
MRSVTAMIDLHFWPTPNGYKILLFLEEAELPYRIVPVNIGQGEQFAPEFLRISPNNKMPAIVDHAPAEGSDPISVFESGAILLYLAEKLGRFLPSALAARVEVLEWLFWQVGGLGPMAGQNHHYSQYAPEKIPYAIDRYVRETGRLYAVLNRRLRDREYIAGEYSIADMAAYPWIVPYRDQQQTLDDFPDLKRWFLAVAERPATRSAYAKGAGVKAEPATKETAKNSSSGSRPKP